METEGTCLTLLSAAEKISADNYLNHPDPLKPPTRIHYGLEKPSQVSLKVYTVLGVEVATLVNDYQEAGTYTVLFNTNEEVLCLSSGVYICRFESGSYVSMKRLILMK